MTTVHVLSGGDPSGSTVLAVYSEESDANAMREALIKWNADPSRPVWSPSAYMTDRYYEAKFSAAEDRWMATCPLGPLDMDYYHFAVKSFTLR